MPNNFYHIYARGNRKSPIFFERKDFTRFLEKLEEYRKKYQIEIIAYCLINNHFHILVRQKGDFSVSRFVGTLTNSHARYLSVKNRLPPGHVFQGRFGAKLIDSEESLLQVSRYIHLNPIKEKILSLDFSSKKAKKITRLSLIEKLRTYHFSSYRNYLSGQTGLVGLDFETILTIQKNKELYRKFVEAKISFDDVLALESY